jgi:hypothetical protein
LCPGKKDIHPIAKRKKSDDETNLKNIIDSASSNLNSYSVEARKYLISLAKDGSLEQHQTKGNITKFADELLRKLRG